jgi:hypothetical protein
VDYSNEDAILVRNPSSWSRNSSNLLCLDTRTCLRASCLSVLAFACTSRRAAVQVDAQVSNLTKAGSGAAHSLVSSNS